MERAVYKIGQEVEITEDFEFETMGGRKFKVKDGDKGILTSKGTIRYINGNAKGLIQKADCDLKGYDNRNIAILLLKNLDKHFGIGDYLNSEDIDVNDVVNEIEYTLDEIL